VIGDKTVIPNPFWGGALFPLVVLGVLMLWPWAERRLTGDTRAHNLLDRPRDAPFRTAFGVAFLTWVGLVFFAGSSDRLFVWLGLSYVAQIWFWRFAIWIIPLILAVVTYRTCRGLQRIEVIEAARETVLEPPRSPPARPPASTTRSP
jgi:ubiquinol-cytochrome c reductase cytochrome b subunit